MLAAIRTISALLLIMPSLASADCLILAITPNPVNGAREVSYATCKPQDSLRFVLTRSDGTTVTKDIPEKARTSTVNTFTLMEKPETRGALRLERLEAGSGIILESKSVELTPIVSDKVPALAIELPTPEVRETQAEVPTEETKQVNPIPDKRRKPPPVVKREPKPQAEYMGLDERAYILSFGGGASRYYTEVLGSYDSPYIPHIAVSALWERGDLPLSFAFDAKLTPGTGSVTSTSKVSLQQYAAHVGAKAVFSRGVELQGRMIADYMRVNQGGIGLQYAFRQLLFAGAGMHMVWKSQHWRLSAGIDLGLSIGYSTRAHLLKPSVNIIYAFANYPFTLGLDYMLHRQVGTFRFLGGSIAESMHSASASFGLRF